jgi:two-component system, NtrC family, sensor kinase
VIPKNQLTGIIEGLSDTYGDNFFKRITQELDKAIGANYTFIARIDPEKYESSTIALVAQGSLVENFSYSLVGTPCANVAENNVCCYPEGVVSLYPQDQLLIDMKIEGYIGTPLKSSKGELLGLTCALFEKPIENTEFITALFTLFSGRISAEIERTERESELAEFNVSLERIVAERTQKLTQALAQVKQSQEHLIAQEKMASLGDMVAGVAHEINTPLGVALLGNSTLKDNLQKLRRDFELGSLSKSKLASYLDLQTELQEAVEVNLNRAADLVSNFKQVAIERHDDSKMSFEFCTWLQVQVSSLRPLLNKRNIKLECQLPKTTIMMNTVASQLSQVLVNVISNASRHAFIKRQQDCVITLIVKSDLKFLTLTLIDNGDGMTSEVLSKIFQPFFTTLKNRGGTGLGLNIVQNIVTNGLKGSLEISSKPDQGTKVHIVIPQEL